MQRQAWVLAALLVGCGSDDSGSGTSAVDAGSDADQGDVRVDLSPADATDEEAAPGECAVGLYGPPRLCPDGCIRSTQIGEQIWCTTECPVEGVCADGLACAGPGLGCTPACEAPADCPEGWGDCTISDDRPGYCSRQ